MPPSGDAPAPVFGGEMATAKIQTAKGRRGDFFAPAKKYYSALMVWIVGTGRAGIVFNGEICYI